MQVEIHSSFVRDTKKLPAKVKEDISDAMALMQNAKPF
jgi:mRNA-degrading endonuclease RelE of RelBE toxin-antitoxin system